MDDDFELNPEDFPDEDDDKDDFDRDDAGDDDDDEEPLNRAVLCF